MLGFVFVKQRVTIKRFTVKSEDLKCQSFAQPIVFMVIFKTKVQQDLNKVGLLQFTIKQGDKALVGLCAAKRHIDQPAPSCMLMLKKNMVMLKKKSRILAS